MACSPPTVRRAQVCILSINYRTRRPATGDSDGMAARFSSTGLIIEGQGVSQSLLGFLDCVLRGIGQVMLQNNSYTGLLFVIGVCYSSLLFGAALLLGSAVSTATAMLLGVDRRLVRAGLFGFNGGLVGIALLYFLQPNVLTWGCVGFAAACSTIAMAALLSLLDGWKIPALTAPFVFISLCFFLATARFGRLQTTGLLPTAGLPKTVAVEGVVTASSVVEGLFNGLAQVFFRKASSPACYLRLVCSSRQGWPVLLRCRVP